jgi:membrane-bound lytic murein transglycosylase D
VYNDRVQSYIDVYTIQQKDHLAEIIGRAELYFPIFEEYLDKYGLPQELKYMAVVESALDPTVQSSSGARGLWQFLYQASRLFNLRVDSYVDERCDPVKSTDAACRYLKYLYDNFQDWNLVMAAYNGGIAVVNDAIERAGGVRDFWAIRSFLPAETQGYIPAFIAVNFAMNFYMHYDIIPIKQPFNYDDLGFVFLEKSVSMQQLSSLIGVPVDTLTALNPLYTKSFIPVVNEPVQIVIPRDKVMIFLRQRTLFVSENQPPVAIKPIGFTGNCEQIMHKVMPGDFFHKVAMEYHVRVEDIQKWNNLTTRHLDAGQILVIYREKQGLGTFLADDWIGKVN